MKLISTILCFLAITQFTKSEIAQWQEIVQQDGYFSRLHDQNFVLVLFFNSDSCQSCQNEVLNQLKTFENNSYFKEKEIDLLYIDVIKTPFFKKHYDLEDQQYLYFFTRNQLKKFPEFEDFIGQDQLPNKIEDFVKLNIERIAQEVIQLDRLKALVDEHDIIGVYLGDKNENFEKFYELALRNIDFNFYTIFNKALKQKVYQNFSVKDSPENDVFVVLRSDILIDNYDKNQLVEFNKWSSKFDLKKFFEFERYPKLRNCEYNKLNVQELFYKRHFMIVYITAEDEEESKLQEFKKSIQYLPKRMIYSKCQHDSKDINHYLHLFLLGNSSFIPGGLYLVKVTPSAKVHVQQFTGNFTNEEISNFVFEIYERNKHFFVDPEEQKEEQLETKEL